MRLWILTSLAVFLVGGSLLREYAKQPADSAAPEAGEPGETSALQQNVAGCSCRREVIDSNPEENTSLWRCTHHYCQGTCYCQMASVTYNIYNSGMSPGLCDSGCTDTKGCVKYVMQGSSAAPLADDTTSFRLETAQIAGGDDTAGFGIPLGAGSENKHLAAAAGRDGWYVEVGGVRLRLFQLDVGRVGKDGLATAVRIPAGYEVAAGPEKEGVVDFVRPVLAVDHTGETPVTRTVAGFYEVGVRRRPDAPVEIYAVRTASELKLPVQEAR